MWNVGLIFPVAMEWLRGAAAAAAASAVAAAVVVITPELIPAVVELNLSPPYQPWLTLPYLNNDYRVS